MRVDMPGRVTLALVSAAAFSSFANAAVPADPTITDVAVLPKRQNSDRFIGYVEFSGTWYTETCNAGLTWYQDGKYAQCCPATAQSCYAPTACVSGSLIYPYPDRSTTRTIPCTENYGDTKLSICNTAFIFESFGDSSPKTDIVCGQSSVNWSYYRKVPATVTEVSSKTPTSIAQPVSTALNLPNQQTNGGSSGGGSKAWIAGAVVGPIVGLALIGAAIFFFLRKKKSKNNAPQQGGAAMAGTDPSQPPVGVGGFTDAKPQFTQQQQQQPYNPDPYAQQGAYNAQQQGYPQPAMSPAPQYNGAPPANNQEYYGSDVKHAYSAPAPANGAAELGGGMSGAAGSSNAAPQMQQTPHQAAELGGSSTATAPTGNGRGQFTSELPGSSAPAKH